MAGAVVSLAIGGMLAAIRWASGDSLQQSGEAATTDQFLTRWIVLALIGYTMAAGRYLNAAILADVYESAGVDRKEVRQLDEVAVFGTARPVLARSRMAGAFGALIGLIILVAFSARRIDEGARLVINVELVAWLILVPLLFFLLARAAFNTVLGSMDRDNARPYPVAPHVDLLDLRPVYALGRIGLRLALVWIVGSTISSLLFFDPILTWPILPFLLTGIGVAFGALLMPSRRLHRTIQDAKRLELERLQPELDRARDDVMQGRAREAGRLADLLAYRTYIEEIRDWPFDNTTVARFLLYLLIPVGSWLGGAFVERLVSSLLD